MEGGRGNCQSGVPVGGMVTAPRNRGEVSSLALLVPAGEPDLTCWAVAKSESAGRCQGHFAVLQQQWEGLGPPGGNSGWPMW